MAWIHCRDLKVLAFFEVCLEREDDVFGWDFVPSQAGCTGLI